MEEGINVMANVAKMCMTVMKKKNILTWIKLTYDGIISIDNLNISVFYEYYAKYSYLLISRILLKII